MYVYVTVWPSQGTKMAAFTVFLLHSTTSLNLITFRIWVRSQLGVRWLGLQLIWSRPISPGLIKAFASSHYVRRPLKWRKGMKGRGVVAGGSCSLVVEHWRVSQWPWIQFPAAPPFFHALSPFQRSSDVIKVWIWIEMFLGHRILPNHYRNLCLVSKWSITSGSHSDEKVLKRNTPLDPSLVSNNRLWSSLPLKTCCHDSQHWKYLSCAFADTDCSQIVKAHEVWRQYWQGRGWQWRTEGCSVTGVNWTDTTCGAICTWSHLPAFWI